MSLLDREAFRAALQSLRANRMRSILTTLGVVIGVASVVMVVQLSKGLEGRILKEVRKQGAHTFSLDSYPRTSEDVFARVVPIDALQISELRRLVPEIQLASPQASSWMSGPELRRLGRSRKPGWRAVDEHGLEAMNLDLGAGRPFTATDRIFRRPVLILGHGLATQLGVDAGDVGGTLTFGGQTAELIGILKPQDVPFSGEDGQEFGPDVQAFLPFGAFREILPANAYELPSWEVHVSLSMTQEAAEQAVRSGLRSLRGLKGKEPDNFGMESSAEQEKEVRKITRSLMAASAGLMGISLLVGGIGVMNIMLVSVTERTREIGVRKAMGAKRKGIQVQFLVEAVVLCVLGGLLGLALGLGAGQLLSKLLLHFQAWPSLAAMVIALLVPSAVGLFFGLYPANKAARLDPIEALRYE